MHGNYYHGAQEQNKEDRGRVSVTQQQQPPPQVNNKSVSPGLSSVQQRIKALEEQKRQEAEKQQAARAKTPTFQDRQSTSPMQQSTTSTRQSQIQGQPQPVQPVQSTQVVQAIVRPSQAQQPAMQIKQSTVVESEKPVSINERIKALSKKAEMQAEEERQKQVKDQQVKERPNRTPGPSDAKLQDRPSQVQQMAASFQQQSQRPSQLQKTENHMVHSQPVQHERQSERNMHQERPSQQIHHHAPAPERPSQLKNVAPQETAQISPIQERISRLKQQEQQASNPNPAPQPAHQQTETSPQPNNINILKQRWQQQQQQQQAAQPAQPKPLPSKLPTHQFEQPKPQPQSNQPTHHEPTHQQPHIQHQQTTVQPTVSATQSVTLRPSITPDPRIEKTKLNSKFDPNFLMSLSMQVQHGALKPKTFGGEPTTSGTKIENVGPINVSYENLQKDQNSIASQLSGVLAKGRPQQQNNEGMMEQKSQMNHDLAEIMKQRNKRTVQNMEV